jgi:ubiquinone/menaquinone biosynthesis C-methylase UbiE
MADPGGNRFDRWYEQMAADEVRHHLVANALELPVSMRVTGLLPAAGLAEVIDDLGLCPGSLLVDLACGRGGYSREIARVCDCELIGIDASSVAISQAREDLLRDDGTGSVRFQVADFESTGLPEKIADAVVCIDSYQFASSTTALCAEALRITRPGGRLVLTGAMRRTVLEGDSATPVEKALTDAGWTDVHLSARPEWLAAEERLWRAALAEPTATPAVEAMKAEGAELLRAMPHIQRFIASAVRAPSPGAIQRHSGRDQHPQS